MEQKPRYTRPPFNEALTRWKAHLAQHGLPTDLVWLFEENLCFEKDPAAPGGFRLGFQTTFTPPPAGAEVLAYEYFSDFDARLVFYRLGSCRGKSACVLLCDDWFEKKSDKEGFVKVDEWLMAFRPGAQEEVPELTDRARWTARMLRDRPLHDLDFCMTLRAVHEVLAHGRVLTQYEHSALKLLDLWRRVFGKSH